MFMNVLNKLPEQWRVDVLSTYWSIELFKRDCATNQNEGRQIKNAKKFNNRLRFFGLSPQQRETFTNFAVYKFSKPYCYW